MLIDDDDITVEFPLEVEDEYITSLGCFAQPPDRTPVIAGFVRITRLFRVLSRILGLLRRAKRSVDLASQTDWAREQIELLASELQTEMDLLPTQLNPFHEPSETPNEQMHAFETCKANLLVTHALARFDLYQFSFLTGVYDHCLDTMTQSVLKRLDMWVDLGMGNIKALKNQDTDRLSHGEWQQHGL